MAQRTNDEILNRVKTLAGRIERDVYQAKMKYGIREEYKKGIFHSIPKDLFDKDELLELQRIYIVSTKNYQWIPSGLFDFSKKSEKKIFFESLISKVEQGIIIDFSQIPTGMFSKQEEKLLLTIAKHQTNRLNLDLEIAEDEYLDIFYKNSNYKEKNHFYSDDMFEYSEHLLRSERKKDVEEKHHHTDQRADSKRKLKTEIAKLEYKKKISSKNLYLELEKKYKKEFKKIDLRCIKSITADIGNILTCSYSMFKTNDINDISNNQESFEIQKEILIEIIRLLEKTGCLDELIISENNNINEINKFLSDENKISQFSDKEKVLEQIRRLQMSVENDIEKMLVFNRHFINKLAHNFDEYMVTELVLNSANIKKRVNGLIEAYLSDPQNKKNANKANAELKEIGISTSIQSLRIQAIKKIIDDGVYTSKSDAEELKKNPEKALKAIIDRGNKPKDINNLIVQNIQAIVNTHINAHKDSINDKKILKCQSIFKEFDKLHKDYNLYFKKNSNSFIAFQPFEELLKDIFEENTRKKINVHKKYDDIKEVQNVKKFISKLKEQGIIQNINDVLMDIAENLEAKELLYNVKHFTTLSLIEASHLEGSKIQMRNNPANGEIPGVVDVLVDGHMQIFGGHYKENDFETTNFEIQSLPGVPREVNDTFMSPNETQILSNVFIPLEEITQGQRDEFERNLQLMEFIENQNNEKAANANSSKMLIELKEKILKDESWKERLKNLEELYKQDRVSFNALKLKFVLGCGLETYRRYYEGGEVITQEAEISSEEAATLETLSNSASLVGANNEGSRLSSRTQNREGQINSEDNPEQPK